MASDSASAPGALFRDRREANGWSVADVAAALCLSSAQVRALEADDFGSLPGETYVLGYWRNYENLLGLTVGESAATYRRDNPAPGRAERRRIRASSSSAGDASARHLRLAFTLLSVVFLLGIWYWQSAGDGSGGDDLYRAGGDAAGDATVTADDAHINDATVSDDDAHINDAGDDDTVATDNTVTDTTVTDTTDTITFALHQASWLEVHDRTGKRLIYRVVPAGRRLSLQGEPPFAVVIGNAAGVAVRYQGAEMPLAAAGENALARLTVGAP